MRTRIILSCRAAAVCRRGVTSLEYAVLGSMIAAAIGLAVAAVGRTTGANFQSAITALGGGTAPATGTAGGGDTGT
jgi:Flp pilus assembly pilin Flp